MGTPEKKKEGKESQRKTPEVATPKKYPSFSRANDDPFEVSFSDLLESFYGDKVKDEIKKASDYNQKAFPPIVLSNGTVLSESTHPWGENAVSGLTDGRLDKPIAVRTKLDPDVAYGREHATPWEHRITIDSPSKYDSKTLNAIMQHEGGHVIYNPSDYSHEEGQGNYYANPQEFATELAHMQRQQFQRTGKRFDRESFLSYLDDQLENPEISKPFQEFAGPTREMLGRFWQWKRQIKYDNSEEAKQEMEEALSILPGLVQKPPSLEEETTLMVRNYLSSRSNPSIV
jgi:hypothetical protein